MSTTHSPPETPQRKLNLETGVVTSKVPQNHKLLTTGENIEQVPSSNPLATVPQLTANEEEVVHTVNEQQDVVGRQDLQRFDWRDLQLRYTDALAKANAEEDQLTDLFEAYSEAFMIWAQTSAECDNNRAKKRLKTQEVFVQMSEKELEEKKAHYMNVVEAFKGAMKLLQSSASSRY